jgi:hypothetical protein
MDREDIIKLAREAGLAYGSDEKPLGSVTRFAALVAAAEREACAKVCEDEASRAKWNWGNDLPQNQPFWNGGEQLASSCAAAIRARGEQ